MVSSLSVLGHAHYIEKNALFNFIFQCQDEVDGGFADKPGNQPDVYHTFFALCGLSLLDHSAFALHQINPVYALPYEVLEKLSIDKHRGLLVGRSEK